MSSEPVRVLVTLQKSLLSDPGQLDSVCRNVEQTLSGSSRSLLRFGILSGVVERAALGELEKLPGVQAVELDKPKFAVGG